MTNTQPTWDLIDALMGQRMAHQSKLELQARMQACGANSLIELVAAEALHHGASVPVVTKWDPAAPLEAGRVLALHPPHWKYRPQRRSFV